MFKIYHDNEVIESLIIKLDGFELTHYYNLENKGQWMRFLRKESDELELSSDVYSYTIRRSEDQIEIIVSVEDGNITFDIITYIYEDVEGFNKIIKDIIDCVDKLELWSGVKNY